MALDIPDVWAPVGTADLPAGLVHAFGAGDWTEVKRQLRVVMDTAITDGRYGRELLQLVLALPTGLDPVFDRYRAAAMLDHGDWDGLRASVGGAPIETFELRGIREIITAPLDRDRIPEGATELDQQAQFEVYEFQTQRDIRKLKHWVQRVAGVYTDALWRRDDVAIGRHLRYRQLQDTALLAVAHAQGGRLDVAHGLASEAQRLGDDGEPYRYVAADLVSHTRLAMGDRLRVELEVPRRIREPTGPSPLGAGEMILSALPFLPLRDDDSLAWHAEFLGYVASRLASPRWQLIADSWRVADGLRASGTGHRTELASLFARARRSALGLRALPTFLMAAAHRRYDGLTDAERWSRYSGNVWLQVSALTWMVGLDPTPISARRLRRLLEITGWRRPVLVPSEIAADAALGMTSLGERSEAILELALTADRPNVTTELVSRYLDDAAAPLATRLAAVDALARVGTTHAREILARVSQRRDEIGRAAARAADRPAIGLSEREIEVLSLAAHGLTNKQIGEKLFLSPHTIARHLANARSKLGASNRAEAAVLLHRSAEAS